MMLALINCFCKSDPTFIPIKDFYDFVLWLLTFPSVVTADLQERRVVLENLHSELMYQAFMMVSTYGGSLNGSRIHFEVEPFGWCYIVQLDPAELFQREDSSFRMLFWF